MPRLGSFFRRAFLLLRLRLRLFLFLFLFLFPRLGSLPTTALSAGIKLHQLSELVFPLAPMKERARKWVTPLGSASTCLAQTSFSFSSFLFPLSFFPLFFFLLRRFALPFVLLPREPLAFTPAGSFRRQPLVNQRVSLGIMSRAQRGRAHWGTLLMPI